MPINTKNHVPNWACTHQKPHPQLPPIAPTKKVFTYPPDFTPPKHSLSNHCGNPAPWSAKSRLDDRIAKNPQVQCYVAKTPASDVSQQRTRHMQSVLSQFVPARQHLKTPCTSLTNWLIVVHLHIPVLWRTIQHVAARSGACKSCPRSLLMA